MTPFPWLDVDNALSRFPDDFRSVALLAAHALHAASGGSYTVKALCWHGIRHARAQGKRASRLVCDCDIAAAVTAPVDSESVDVDSKIARLDVSDRQRQVARMLSEGLSRTEIGDRLGISPATVCRDAERIADAWRW